MARTRRRSSYRKSRRWNPRARRGRGRRRNCNPKAKAGYSRRSSRRGRRNPRAAKGYVPLNRTKFRRKTIWNMARRGKRTFKHLNPRGRKGRSKARSYGRGRRRNPSGTQLRDGTSIQVSGSDVTLFSPFGETYEFSDLSIGALKKLRRATSFSQANRIASSEGVTRSINPRRRRSKSRSRR